MKTVIFLHIPKTAGLTLYDVLNREYGRGKIFTFEGGRQRLKESIERFKQMPEGKRASYRLLRGHAPFGLHEFVPHPCAYVTLLRDPVKRVISHYYYVLANPNHALHGEVTGRGWSLAEYVASGITTELDNDQTRLLAGVGDRVPFGGCSPDLLAQAIDHIETRFEVVGLAERFDESLLLMMQRLEWRSYPLYTRQNVSRRGAAEGVGAATRRLIEEQNGLDCELYAYARRRFEEALGELDERMRRRFELLNRLYRPYGRVYSGGRSLWGKFRNRKR